MSRAHACPRGLLVALSVVTALALPASARAQAPTIDAALAETLFREAKLLMEAGNYPVACPKLAESQRLDPGTGTLLAIALCHQGEGKTATAWAEFADVVTAANKDGRADRVKFARERMVALERTLSRLTVDVPASLRGVSGLEVKRNGIVIGKAAWGTAMPVDPGVHVVEASAPGKRRMAVTMTIGTTATRRP